MSNSSNESETARRQREEWERAQQSHLEDGQKYEKPSQIDDIQTNSKTKLWHRRGFRVALSFWSDGILRLIVICILSWSGYVTVKTDFWSYSPFGEKAENVLVCWPIHYFRGEGRHPEYRGDISYVNREKLPPEFLTYYDPIKEDIQRRIAEPQGQIREAMKWGGFPIIRVASEAYEGSKDYDGGTMKIDVAASSDEQECKYHHEGQLRPLANNN